MKNSRGLFAVLGIVTIAALGFGTFTYLHRAAAEQVYAYNCGLVDYKPISLTKDCANEGIAVGDLQWDTWGADGATGVGKYAANPCKPTCTAEAWQYVDIKVKLTKVVTDKGKKVLSQIEVTTSDGKKLPLSNSATDSWVLVSNPAD
jgi:hypothetical protein